jgi:hypothetical protein
MAREAWAKAGEGWVDQHWYADREKAFKEFEALVRADEREQALAAPVQEPVAWLYKGDAEFDGKEWQDSIRVTTSKQVADWQGKDIQPLYTTLPATQPAVPDAFGTRESEHPEYIQGWNDCRAEMLKGRHEPV